MIIDVKVPQLSESVSEATLVSWHKQVGEAVSRDENLIDIETDKVILELPAPAAGVLVELLKQDGQTVEAEELIARIDTEAVATVVSAEPPAPVEAVPAASAEPGKSVVLAVPSAPDPILSAAQADSPAAPPFVLPESLARAEHVA